jgi:hypothetical protein
METNLGVIGASSDIVGMSFKVVGMNFNVVGMSVFSENKRL